VQFHAASAAAFLFPASADAAGSKLSELLFLRNLGIKEKDKYAVVYVDIGILRI
jgi:hypothetical protein